MNIKFDVELDFGSVNDMLSDVGLLPMGTVQKFIDSEVIRLSDPYVPFRTGMLKSSAIAATVIGSGMVVWNTPYARKMFYNPQFNFNGAPMRGAYWAERMAADRLDEIVRGAERLAGGAG